MAILYFAKVNVNSEIKAVYNKKKKISDIMEDIYTKIDDEKEYEIGGQIIKKEDIDGTVKEIKRPEESYQFAKLEKTSDETKCYITGKVIRKFVHFAEVYDETEKDSKPKASDVSSSIYFYFDLVNEIITFTVRRNFKYNQFIDAVKGLLKKYTNKGFEIYLIQDIGDIREKLKRLKKVTKFQTTLVPPNANDEELKALLEASKRDVEDSVEAGVGKQTNILEADDTSSGIDVSSNYIQRFILGYDVVNNAERGYGEIIAEGIDKSGNTMVYNSQENSNYIAKIPDKDSKNIGKIIKISDDNISKLRIERMNKLNKINATKKSKLVRKEEKGKRVIRKKNRKKN